MNPQLIKSFIAFITDDTQQIAIACGRTDDGTNHTGLALKIDGSFRMLHFGWHKYLVFNEDISFFKTLYWVNFEHFNLYNDPLGINKQILISFAHKVFKKSEKNIPYGINYFGDYFDEDGLLLITDSAVGLTCATFLLAFFKGYGLELINHAEWPQREDDKGMQERTLSMMQKTNVPEGHIGKVASENVKARFLPEEVTASSACVNLPAGFSFCKKLGAEINAMLS